jgi:hypothetical protein
VRNRIRAIADNPGGLSGTGGGVRVEPPPGNVGDGVRDSGVSVALEVGGGVGNTGVGKAGIGLELDEEDEDNPGCAGSGLYLCLFSSLMRRNASLYWCQIISELLSAAWPSTSASISFIFQSAVNNLLLASY